MTAWLTAVLLIVAALAATVAAAMALGSSRWKTGTRALRVRLEAARINMTQEVYDARELEGLPPPVRRYFAAALKDGQPMVCAVQLTQEGQFNQSGSEAKWRRFTASQLVVTRRPGFDWDARIEMAPGMNVFVHDAYVEGEGTLHAALLGLVTLADMRGTPELAQGELLRFLAEAAWYPTALLPSQGVRWESIDESSARANLLDGETAVSLDFRFSSEGLISDVRAAARHRVVRGAMVAAPWLVRFWSYETRDGMRIPMEGEVAWELPEGPWPYWRGRTREIAYQLAAKASWSPRP